MLTAPQRDLVRDKGTVLARVLIGLLFFVSGMSILFMQGPENVAGFSRALASLWLVSWFGSLFYSNSWLVVQ